MNETTRNATPSLIACVIAVLLTMVAFLASPAPAHAAGQEYGGTDATEPYANPDFDGDGFGDNVAFTTPSAINFVVRADGSLIGPTNAAIVNAGSGGIHVSSVRTSERNGFSFVENIEAANGTNSIALTFGTTGSTLNAANYKHKALIADAEPWAMEAAESVPLTFGGSAKDITADMASMTTFGIIEWFVQTDAVYVSFDANGGSGTMATVEITDGMTAPANGFMAPEGGTFTGWNTESDGSGTSYAVGSTLPGGANLTLYAQWARSTDGTAYGILDPNGKLTLFRSNEAYSASGYPGNPKTATDIMGNTYSGQLYTGVESTGTTRWSVPWYAEASSIKSVEVAENQVIQPAQTANWFYFANNITSCDLHGLDTSNVTDMSYMFFYCSSIGDLDVTHFDTSNVTDMSFMFGYCSGLKSLDVTGFDTSNVTSMESMFDTCSSLAALDVTHFDTSKVTDMKQMFAGTSSLASLDVTRLDTSSVTTMDFMFNTCSSLTSLDVTHLDTSNATTMAGMFANCKSLTSLDTTSFDTSSATNMAGMFANCTSLTSVDVTNLDISSVTNMYGMFQNCSSLTTIYSSADADWSASPALADGGYMFTGCNSLIGGNGTAFDGSHAHKDYARVDGLDGHPGYFTVRFKMAYDGAGQAVAALSPASTDATGGMTPTGSSAVGDHCTPMYSAEANGSGTIFDPNPNMAFEGAMTPYAMRTPETVGADCRESDGDMCGQEESGGLPIDPGDYSTMSELKYDDAIETPSADDVTDTANPTEIAIYPRTPSCTYVPPDGYGSDATADAFTRTGYASCDGLG